MLKGVHRLAEGLAPSNIVRGGAGKGKSDDGCLRVVQAGDGDGKRNCHPWHMRSMFGEARSIARPEAARGLAQPAVDEAKSEAASERAAAGVRVRPPGRPLMGVRAERVALPSKAQVHGPDLSTGQGTVAPGRGGVPLAGTGQRERLPLSRSRRMKASSPWRSSSLGSPAASRAYALSSSMARRT